MFHRELIVDLFAGGGGASCGMRYAFGKDPDVAINHDPVAIAMHRANHPGTIHYQEDVWKVHPLIATRGRPVGLLWASPDCKHFSRAKGSAPKRDKEIRSLAWVVIKWARLARPRVIILENVEEFATWGPLDIDGRIIDSQKGLTFKTFLWQLRSLGYAVDHRCLRACDYGAPTIRKRLFLVARCDGLPIVWPKLTHADPQSLAVQIGALLPWRAASEIIDWSIPCPSILERKRPLAENTMRRIAEGIRRYVINSPKPFIITYYGLKKVGEFRGRGMDEPLPTQTTENRFGFILPHLQRQFGNSVGHAADEPCGTITAGGLGKTALVAAFLTQHNGGSVGHEANEPLSTIVHRGTQQQIVIAHLSKHFGTTIGQEIQEPIHTLTGKTKHGLVTSHLLKLRGTCQAGQPIEEPMPTVTAGGLHIGEVWAFLIKYFGTGIAQGLDEPAHTLTTRDRLGLITVMIGGEPYVIADIGMRMLSPGELFRAQGFTEEYQIDVQVNGRRISKTDQVRMCGNSVCPPIARALVEANMSARHLLNDVVKRA